MLLLLPLLLLPRPLWGLARTFAFILTVPLCALAATFPVHIFLLGASISYLYFDNFFSLCAVSFSLLLFVLLCFAFFPQWAFVWLCDLSSARCAWVPRIGFVTFLKQKVEVCLASSLLLVSSPARLFAVFAFSVFVLSLWLALKVLYELRISFNSFAKNCRQSSVAGCQSSRLQFPSLSQDPATPQTPPLPTPQTWMGISFIYMAHEPLMSLSCVVFCRCHWACMWVCAWIPCKFCTKGYIQQKYFK